MRKSTKKPPKPPATTSGSTLVPRIARPLSLVAQVEQILRDAIGSGKFQGDRLPTEVDLAEQLGVSRETVRRATEALQREGLLVKFRRKGTFTSTPSLSLKLDAAPSTLVGYLQADYPVHGVEEAVNRTISGRMLQGAIEQAGKAGFELIVRHSPHAQMGEAFRRLTQASRLRGVIFASFGEEKLMRRVTELGLPTVLLDHDLHLPKISSIRDDSAQGAQQAVAHLASLGHRRIAFAHWHRTDLNPWRLTGYRRGLRDKGLPRRRAWELACELTEEGARQVAQALCGMTPMPTALLCFNNTLARLVIEELAKRGLRVPPDISVMGAGGEEVPGMTCNQVDWHLMGQRAVQILLEAVDDPVKHVPVHELSPHVLHVGQTTAKAGK